MCKSTDVTNDGGRVDGDSDGRSTAQSSADCNTSRKRCRGELYWFVVTINKRQLSPTCTVTDVYGPMILHLPCLRHLHHKFYSSDKQSDEIERAKRRKKDSEEISQHHIGIGTLNSTANVEPL